jgi:sugar phosphate permease
MNGFDAIAWLARVGFLVKGVLYMVIGALALQVAAKAGGRVTGTRGALTTVLGQPFGRTLLLVDVVGILSYSTRRIIQVLI